MLLVFRTGRIQAFQEVHFLFLNAETAQVKTEVQNESKQTEHKCQWAIIILPVPVQVITFNATMTHQLSRPLSAAISFATRA